MSYELIGWSLVIVGMILIVFIVVSIERALVRLVEIVAAHNKRLARDQEAIKGSLDEIKKHRGGYVTDPFKVANSSSTPGASSDNIIKRKTPDQIRAENYEKIKNGQSYGHID